MAEFSPAHRLLRRSVASVTGWGLLVAPLTAGAAPERASDDDASEVVAQDVAQDVGAPDVAAEAPPADAAESPAVPDATDPAPDADEGDETDDDAADDDDDDADDTEAAEPTDDDADDQAQPASSAGADLPPLTTLQRAGWWTLFGAFTVGSVAGVFAGLAERQEDRATRLANRFDLDQGAQPQYADVQDEYEGYLDRGRAFQSTAIAFAVVTGVAAIAGVTLFAVDASRRRGPKQSATSRKRRSVHTKVHVGAGSVRVRF